MHLWVPPSLAFAWSKAGFRLQCRLLQQEGWVEENFQAFMCVHATWPAIQRLILVLKYVTHCFQPAVPHLCSRHSCSRLCFISIYTVMSYCLPFSPHTLLPPHTPGHGARPIHPLLPLPVPCMQGAEEEASASKRVHWLNVGKYCQSYRGTQVTSLSVCQDHWH